MSEKTRPDSDGKEELEIFDAVRDLGGENNPVEPTRLKTEDSFCFSCHKGISCWNKCCTGADITLTPNDILRLRKHFKLSATEFLQKYTVPAFWEQAGLPVAKIKMNDDDGKGACPFLADEGCTVYENRPVTCRYYPLGLASVKPKGSEVKEDFHFLVKETHCKGHDETKELSVSEFKAEQAIEEYDLVNRGWIDILMKMSSWKHLGGPNGKDVSPQTKQMFFMASTDVETLRKFILETKFLETYDIDPEAVEIIKTDDQALLQLGFDWLKSVMFNEQTISLKEQVLRGAMAKAREELGAT
jgi:hypothetical protein